MNPDGIDDALAEYGQQLGVPGLALGAHGVAQLELQAGGLLAVEPARGGTDVLVYLGRPLGFDGMAVLRSALAAAHYSAAPLMPLQLAISGDGPEALLIALVRVPGREFTAQMLGRVVDYLGRWSDGVRHG